VSQVSQVRTTSASSVVKIPISEGEFIVKVGASR
jgi:hypothetical protein